MKQSRLKIVKGFTLIELAVVLVIIGLILGSFVGTVSSRIEATHIAETKKDLAKIKNAIFGFVYKNGVFPCPDTDGNGQSNSVCVSSGQLPYATLGLGSGDAWNNRYEYWVDTNFETAFTLDTNPAIANGGRINQRNSADTIELLANNTVAIIHSKGKNGLGATGVDGLPRAAVPGVGHVDEVENNNGDNIFVSRPPTSAEAATAGGEFDDQLIWISEFELKAKMVEAGKLP